MSPAPDSPHEQETEAPKAAFLRRDGRKLSRAVLLAGVAAAGVAAVGTVALAATLTGLRRGRSGKFRGKTVLITGSSRGLGLAMAEEFARLGARVVLTARDGEELERARQWLVQSGCVEDESDVMVIAADLRSPEEAEAVVQRATQVWGQIDVLVNNAGVITVGPVENQRIEDFRAVMEANFFAGLQCTMAALPQMLERKSGSIVNITSIGGKVAVPHLLPYSASKFAAVGFSEGLHAEVRSKGVHVLTVCPGLMRTGSHLNALFSGDAEREYRWFALGATTPFVSASARNAARRIAEGVLDKATEIFITPQAAVVGRLAQVAPELTAGAMCLVNRFLPDATENQGDPQRGAEVRGREPLTATTFGWNAARRYNEM